MEQTGQVQRNWALPFFTIWIGQLFSWIGSSVAGFALIWWVTETTGSGTVLTTAAMVSMLPGILLGPFAGACVDRWNRRQVMIVADGFVALVSAWLAYLFWSGAIQIWHVYVIMLARSIGSCFHWPAMTASTSLMVPRQHLSRVAGLNQTVGGAMNIIAPPIGALLLRVLPLHGIMAIDVVTATIAILPLFFVAIPQPVRSIQAAAGGAAAMLWQDMLAGLRYVWGWPGLRLLLFMAMMLNFVGYPAFTLIPILVTKHFGGHELELSWMTSSFGLGLVVGGLTLSAWGGFRRRILTAFFGLVAGGLAALLIGLTPANLFWLAITGVFLAGAMNAITNGPISAIMQATVAPEMQGRVLTVVGSMCSLVSPLGLAIAGRLADRVGPGTWWLIDGLACILMGVAGLFVPAVMNIEENHRQVAGQEPAEAGLA